jgi:YidC/Oxa1 family membrane protein insertase
LDATDDSSGRKTLIVEKRFISFLILSMLIMYSFQALNQRLNPPVPDPAAGTEVAAEGGAGTDGSTAAAEGPAGEVAAGSGGANGGEASATDPATAANAESDQNESGTAETVASQWATLGSLDPSRPEKMLVWFNNRGATIECIALHDDRYSDLDDNHGYLGYLALTAGHPGARVGAIGEGTPAAMAKPKTADLPVGLQPGDVIVQADEQTIQSPDDLWQWLERSRPDQEVRLVVHRTVGDKHAPFEYAAKLSRRPLEVIRPERYQSTTSDAKHPLSYRLTLQQLGKHRAEIGKDEIAGLPSLWDRNWSMRRLADDSADSPSNGVEFELVVQPSEAPGLDLKGPLRILKRYRLAAPAGAGQPFGAGYHLDYELEFRNEAGEPIDLAYQQDGPTGLPLEGWWYTNKTHPTSFGGAGVRDVIAKTFRGGHKMFTNPNIVKRLRDNPDSIATPMYAEEQPEVQYVGVDAQYFVSALVAPVTLEDTAAQPAYTFASAQALPIAPADPLRESRTDVTFRLISRVQQVPPGGSLKQRFLIFTGPKDPAVVADYQLDSAINYGWFPMVAKPLQWILHGLRAITRNYGIAIILLTLLVRGCLFPLGMKQVRNAAKMQELAPEMKRLAELYKNDMDKRAAAQRELFRKHDYNPLAGCLPVFFQLPIFVGLYRALSVDIELRQAALIPGLRWCSNLAGPDQLFNWSSFMPQFLASPVGWLGPYFNILPIISVALMMVHQKLFTPPPTDEQQEMQHRMMKFMMLFMGLMFFKVPAGLCLYFITSSLWGLAERKLLPKNSSKSTQPATAAVSSTPDKRSSRKGRR